MVRRHGWQQPVHIFQVVAIALFLFLVVAFYVFFAPFVGGNILGYASIATYTPVALLVFILYVRCTTMDPSDPGVLLKLECEAIMEPNKNPLLGRLSTTGGLFCALFVHEDCCKFDKHQEPIDEECELYCTLCETEVRNLTKHCRQCDKCVEGFDHHCRWLNNCVGRKNYTTFFALVGASIIWFAIEAGVGIAVFVRCFVDRNDLESQIIERFGNGLPRALFATIVAICSAVSLLGCLPLCELFIFHVILIRKGITTYQYVVAMRELEMKPTNEAPAGAVIVHEEIPNTLSSQTGSAFTLLSGGRFPGMQYNNPWCPSPCVYLDEVIPYWGHGMAPSTDDPDASIFVEGGNRLSKRPVHLNAWKLAKLDSEEAIRGAAKSRAASSILRPVDNRHDMSLDGNISDISSMRSDAGGITGTKSEMRVSPSGNLYFPSYCSREI